MTTENGTAIVLTYVLVSMGVIIAFLLAAFVIGWFIGRLRQRRHREQREEKKRNELSKRVFRRWRGS
jgi:biotin transporter BioY